MFWKAISSDGKRAMCVTAGISSKDVRTEVWKNSIFLPAADKAQEKLVLCFYMKVRRLTLPVTVRDGTEKGKSRSYFIQHCTQILI